MAIFQATIRRKEKLPTDLRRMLVSTHSRASVVWRKAVRIFIERLAEEVERHQDTGMSYASLFHIAHIVRAKIGSGSTKVEPRKGFTSITGSYYPNRYRDIYTGLSLGAKTAKIQYGHPTNPRYNFEFRIQVYQYMIHEYGLGFHQGKAWESIYKAETAMNYYLAKNARQFVPRFSDIFRGKQRHVQNPTNEE